MSVLKAIGEVFAAAPPLLLAGGALLLVLAAALRRRFAGPGRQRALLGVRLGCVLLALAMLGVAVRRGAISAVRARRSRDLSAAIADAERAGREQSRADLDAWRPCDTPGHDVHGCASIAARLLANPYCADDCIERLRRRPDVMPIADALSRAEPPAWPDAGSADTDTRAD